jgi:hypothetical protein
LRREVKGSPRFFGRTSGSGLTPQTVLIEWVSPYAVPNNDGTRISITFSAQDEVNE